MAMILRGSVLVPASIERTWDLWTDAARYPQWQRGGVYLVVAGAIRRRVTVIGLDPDRVHVRLHPGHLRDRDPDDLVPVSPKPPSDQMDLWPIPPPLRGGFAVTQKGLPFLVRDGGHGVAHLALSRDAWADASAEEVAMEEVREGDVLVVDDWRARSRPTVGVDAALGLAPVCTLRLGVDDAGAEVWVAAVVLRSEIMRVHLSIPGQRWSKRPDGLDPWRHHVTPFQPDASSVGAGDRPQRTGIGHAPVNRSAFKAADPQFVGITTIESEELEGYRIWRERKGGTFDTLQPLVDPPHMDSATRAATGE